jgi:hypothetical protein
VAEPIISSDGNYMWNGAEWIPISHLSNSIPTPTIVTSDVIDSHKSEPWKFKDFVYLTLIPLGVFFGLTGVGASNAGFYVFTLVLNAIFSFILCIIINKLFAGFMVKSITLIITKFLNPKGGRILKIVNQNPELLPIDRFRFSMRSTIFWVVVLISVNILILSTQMDSLYAEDGGNKSPSNLEEFSYFTIWFLSAIVPSLLLPVIIPITLLLNCKAVIVDIKGQNIKKVSSNIKSLFSGFLGASSFLAVLKFILANSGDPNGWGRLDSSQPLLAIFAILHGSLIIGFLMHSIWHQSLIDRIDARLIEKAKMEFHILSESENGVKLGRFE